jgi:hypothetical protein
MDTQSSLESKNRLVEEINGKAAWYRRVASADPDDRHCSHCSSTLRKLAAAVKALPDSHPLFARLERINDTDDRFHARWVDELCLEFSHVAWHSAESTQRAIKQLIEITDDQLWEWKRAHRLH